MRFICAPAGGRIQSTHVGCYMPESQSVFTHAQRPQTHLMESQRLNYPTNGSKPPAYWDNLSKIWLTRSALRELDRRNGQKLASRQSASNQLTQSPSEFLYFCEPATVKAMKRFARAGGPDLSDLTGVSRHYEIVTNNH